MNENLRALLRQLAEDEELQQAYSAALEGKEEADLAVALVAFANDHGYALTIEDLGASKGAVLEDDELAVVAGGFRFDCTDNYHGPYPNSKIHNPRNLI